MLVRQCLVVLSMLVIVSLPTSAQAADCVREVGAAPEAGAALTDAITLSPEKGSEQRQVNFDTSRGVKDIKRVRLVSDKRLPDTLTPKQLAFDALVQRSADKLESVDFTDPTFTAPVITPDRQHIEFTICLSAAGLDAGKYVGNVTVNGPEGVGEARVGITANLKAKLWIWLLGAAAALGLAFSAVFFKATAAERAAGNWWFKTAGVLLVTAGALVTVYLNDPAWGAGIWPAVISLAGTALASVGGRKLLD